MKAPNFDGRLSPEDYAKIMHLGTKRQREIVEALLKYRSQRKAAGQLNITLQSLSSSLKSLKKSARAAIAEAQQGHAPGHWNSGVAPGYKMGKVTIQRAAVDKDNVVIERWWERQHPDGDLLALMRDEVDVWTQDLPRIPTIKRKAKTIAEDLAIMVPLGDPHFGMRAWAEESGEDWNLEVATRDLCWGIHALLHQMPATGHCIIANLGDFFHVATLKGVTPRSGHVMDMAARSAEMYNAGLFAMRRCIETALERHETVEVVNAIGNHDELLAHTMSQHLAAVYENNPRVKIQTAFKWRHYTRFGNTLMGFVHGDKTKDAQLPNLMAQEVPEMWSQTKYRWFLRGHDHHESRVDHNGVLVEQVPVIAAHDSHAVSHGWIAARNLRGYILHREHGEIGKRQHSIDYLRSLFQEDQK